MKSIFCKSVVAFALWTSSLTLVAQGDHYYSSNTLTDPYGKFKVTFTSEPKYQFQDIPTAVGNVRMYMFIMETPTVAYIVSYADYPAEMVAKSDKDEMLKNALGGYIKQLQLTLQSQTKINYENYPGLMFYADNGENYTVLRDYLVNNRLFQLGILQVGKIDAREENDFFDSFVLLK